MDINTLREISNPAKLGSEHLKALWHDLKGDWEKAHNIVQSMSDQRAMWIHAYLHRKEPDIWNARYWYNRCGKPYPDNMPYEDEVVNILSDLLIS